MQLLADVSIENNIDFDGMIARLEALDGKQVTAGVFSGFDAKKAMWNEYGTARGMPARPFLRMTLYENESKWSRAIAPKVAALFDGSSAQEVTSFLGVKMTQDIRTTIHKGDFVALSPATIHRKGHSQPLIDTGSMIGSITHKET